MTKTKAREVDVLKAQTGISTDQVIANILATWMDATDANREDGAQWYLLNQQALEEMANGNGVSLEAAAAVTAHLSPRVHWARALVAAHNMRFRNWGRQGKSNVLIHLGDHDPSGIDMRLWHSRNKRETHHGDRDGRGLRQGVRERRAVGRPRG